MSKVATLYSNEVKKNFKIFYANWEPGGPIQLGDYGVLDRNIFIPVGNIFNEFTEFQGDVVVIREDDKKDNKSFKSDKGVDVALRSKGTLNSAGNELAKAELEIKFSKENAIFFNAAECVTNRIVNKAEIGKILKQLLKAKKWKKRYCVVTDIVKAGKTIIAISESRSSEISFSASSDQVSSINLSDASVGLDFKSEKSIGYRVDAQDGLDILFGLCKLKNPFPWWNGPDFRPKFAMNSSMLYSIENESDIKTETDSEDLFFGQLGME
ncbi:MAG: hypothetical protein HRU26_13495 [Psychroserpens sp.]|nr:hypothetical protein [Psychroserpens sp.]